MPVDITLDYQDVSNGHRCAVKTPSLRLVDVIYSPVGAACVLCVRDKVLSSCKQVLSVTCEPGDGEQRERNCVPFLRLFQRFVSFSNFYRTKKTFYPPAAKQPSFSPLDGGCLKNLFSATYSR